MNQEDLSPKCIVCGQASTVFKLSVTEAGVRFIYSGTVGSNGKLGDLISNERAMALRAALSPPFSPDKFRSADLYDEAGFCARCSAFYCPTHWNVSSTGGGTCPKGHLKSLDPHWSPE